MKSKSAIILFFMVLFFSMALNAKETLSNDTPSDTSSRDLKKAQANFLMAKWVIGSGGVMGASAAGYRHSATAGEAFIGGMHTDKYVLLSGFWASHIGFPVFVAQEPSETLPTVLQLHQNYPNPFNPQTSIAYDLPEPAIMTIEIFNLMGQKIRTIVDSQLQGPGVIAVTWDGCDDQGEQMGTGAYIYRMTARVCDSSTTNADVPFQQSRKMLFVK